MSLLNIALIFCTWGIFAFVLWRLSRNWTSVQNSFDISVFGVLITLGVHRILYVLFHLEEFKSAYWSVYPYAWEQGQRIIFGTKPWLIFAFWRGGFDYRILLFSALLSVFIINFSLRQRFISTLEQVIVSLLASSPVLIILFWANSVYCGVDFYDPRTIPYIGWTVMKHPIHLYQLSFFIILVICAKLFAARFRKVMASIGYLFCTALLFGNAVLLYYYGYEIDNMIIGWMIGVGSLTALVGLLRMSLGGDEIKKVDEGPFRRSFLNVTQRSYKRFG